MSAQHRDKLRSSNTLGFVSFIPLLGSLVVPPNVVGPASREATPPSHRDYGNADAQDAGCSPPELAKAKASLKSDALR